MPSFLDAPRLSIRDLDLEGRRLFLRADFNVPVDGGAIKDDTRIRETLPTIRLALERGASLVLASHLGRPKGGPDPKASLAPVAARLGKLLERLVDLTVDCVSEATAKRCASLSPGEVVLLENLRFHPEEQKGDAAFAQRLASYADEYANDAFGTCHRADASVSATARCFKHPAAGLLVERELNALSRLLARPERPFVAVLGGAKVSDKLPVMRGLLPKVDTMLVGGAMAYTLLMAKGVAVGSSLAEPTLLDDVRALLVEAERLGRRILLPVDHVVSIPTGSEPTTGRVVDGGFSEGAGFDIGPRTIDAYAREVAAARTVLWNGPLGRFEVPQFAKGTEAMARAVAESKAYTVVGGGDSIAALNATGLSARIGHVSTGGGALLELLAGEPMPGLEALAPAR
jgi:phosphoglycerate kinase